MNVLFISNGSAEDAIGLSLIRYWLSFRDEDRVAALAMVGDAKAYIQNDIPLISPPVKLPSNGFGYQNWKLFFKDIESGLLSNVKNWYGTLKKLSPQVDYVIGVGDIVPVMAIKVLNKPSAFIGCAMSDYYLKKGEGPSSYSSVKRKILKDSNTLVFPRDNYTTQNLLKLGIRAEYHGNPMLDCIEYNKNLELNLSKYARVIGVLPGSHDDARENFRKIIDLAQKMSQNNKPFTYLVAVADKEDIPRYGKDLSNRNWFIQKTTPKHTIWKNNKDELHLLNGYFGNVLMSSHVIIGTSGTGNEQAAGLGIPVVSFGAGSIQYTLKFGAAQQKLLGKSLAFLPQLEPTPEMFLKYVERAFNDTKYREEVKQIAIERFGDFGASERIVYRILQDIYSRSNQ
ncbi:MAG: lipid-A-disaccharide synthase-related protein [Candidatus Sericytochromatia bacterium]